ncbi:MAG: hypothetical protein GTN99_10255, partial [Candidatus Dadabacteria bacterium]|nr:hypothetical protein [Candidatus Dadabacteria bacterium]
EPDTDGYSRNLSPEGMSIVSEKGLPTNSKICIQILCSSTAPIYIEGKVIWLSNPPGVNSLMGIKFTDSNDEILKIYKSRSRYK